MAETTKKIVEGDEEEKSTAMRGIRRFMCELSPDIQELIASSLYAGDSIIFRRLVSKSLTSSLITRRIEPRPLPQFPEFPYLLSLQKRNVLKFHHPLVPGSYSMQIPELSEARIGFSKHGWLLMHNDDGSSFLFEPFSRQKIAIPKRPEHFGFAYMCFNLPPTSPSCFVMAFGLGHGEYLITRPGQDSWTERYVKRGVVFDIFTYPFMRDDGLCYFLCANRSLQAFNPEEKKPVWKVCGQKYNGKLVDEELEPIRRSFLVETSEGEILRVSVVGDEGRVKIWRINVRKKAWSEVQESLGGKMVFLSSNGSLSESSGLRGVSNKIYFPKLHNGANIFYSISAQRYLSFQR